MTNRPTSEKYQLNLEIPKSNQVRFGTESLRYLGPRKTHLKILVTLKLIKNWNKTTCTCNNLQTYMGDPNEN